MTERWSRLFPGADRTEQQQALRIKARQLQDGNAANMHERLASVREFTKYLSQPIARGKGPPAPGRRHSFQQLQLKDLRSRNCGTNALVLEFVYLLTQGPHQAALG